MLDALSDRGRLVITEDAHVAVTCESKRDTAGASLGDGDGVAGVLVRDGHLVVPSVDEDGVRLVVPQVSKLAELVLRQPCLSGLGSHVCNQQRVSLGLPRRVLRKLASARNGRQMQWTRREKSSSISLTSASVLIEPAPLMETGLQLDWTTT